MIPPAAFQDLPYLTHLDLRHCQVELVAEGAFRGLGRLLLLNLASNRLSSLPQEALDGLGSLQRLELEGNVLEELRPGTFGALGALATLNLAHNALVYLPAMAFQGLARARWLQLAHNALSVLAPEALAGLPALRRLSLHHNELQALPGPALSQARVLARLELGHNPFTYVGEEDGLALPGLRELLLDHGALQALDARAFARCPRLHTLDLRGNQLAALPPLQGPGRLRRLRLQGNPLWCGCEARPLLEWLARARVRSDGTCGGPRRLGGEALGALRPADLRCPADGAAAAEEEEWRAAARPRAPPAAPDEADGAARPCPPACVCASESRHSGCEGRGLRAVPRGFPGDTRLLDLRRNHFPSVPRAAFPGLGQLVSLHLQHCGLTELEAGALAGLGSLLYLYLSDNQLAGLRAAALEGAPRLGYLYLERNRFRHVPGAALRALPSLFSLHLQNNAVDRLGPGDLAGLPALRWLYLSGNRITQVSPGAIGPAPELEKLHLDRNQLQGVPTGALEGLPALLELQLSGNPLQTLPDGAFRPVGHSLRHLFLNSSGLEQVRGWSVGWGRQREPHAAGTHWAGTAAPAVRPEAGPGAPGIGQTLCLPPGSSGVGTDQVDSGATQRGHPGRVLPEPGGTRKWVHGVLVHFEGRAGATKGICRYGGVFGQSRKNHELGIQVTCKGQALWDQTNQGPHCPFLGGHLGISTSLLLGEHGATSQA